MFDLKPSSFDLHEDFIASSDKRDIISFLFFIWLLWNDPTRLRKMKMIRKIMNHWFIFRH